ncbi:MAG: hypothetical protein HXX18_14145 [Bacteroidetes bacterium]|nr:hypothetical protein [Bacteroidota bacterium]
MKKSSLILLTVCFFGLLITSCVKDNDTEIVKIQKEEITSTASVISNLKSNNSTGNFSGIYSMSTNAGHKSTDCGGKCRYLNGVYFHSDCQGFGHECGLRATVSISKTILDKPEDKYYNGMGLNDYEPIDEATFNMPARSFYVKNDKFDNGYIWINIPEQLLERDKETHQFIYKNITFTKEQMFKNL